MRQSRPTDNTFASDLYAVQIHTCTRISEMCFSNSGPASNIFKLTLEFTLSNERFEIHRGAVPRKLLFIYLFFFFMCDWLYRIKKIIQEMYDEYPSFNPSYSITSLSLPTKPSSSLSRWHSVSAVFKKKRNWGARNMKIC